MMLAVHGLDFGIAEAVIVHWLPHTAGVRNRGKARHRHRHESADKQEHKQKSGGQAMHGGCPTPGSIVFGLNNFAAASIG
jgi:hypothetical protein